MGKVWIAAALALNGCAMVMPSKIYEPSKVLGPIGARAPAAADYTLTADATHNKFSRAIPPALRVPSGAVVEVFTEEATGGQLKLGDGPEELAAVDFNRVHALTGPVYVEGAAPGDVLAVTLLELEPGDWGWTGVWPDFGLLAGEERKLDLKTYPIDKARNAIEFADGVRVPLAPFPGVMGVAPDTDEMLSTVPPRANGGNMDDPDMTVGTTIYFPVFVEGALFSVGDTHAAQGAGEVGGSAVEAPMRIVYRIEVMKGARAIEEPQYETDAVYATTGFATTLDEAAKKATRYMLDYLEETRGMTRSDAYMLCSLVCDLKIAETVDTPHMLVTMHLPKAIFEDVAAGRQRSGQKQRPRPEARPLMDR